MDIYELSLYVFYQSNPLETFGLSWEVVDPRI